MGNQSQNNFKHRDIAQNFLDFRPKYSSYHYSFGLWEFMNGVCVFFSMCATHWLLNYKFFSYGLEVFSYMESLKSITPTEGTRKHDPMCELFPTEVPVEKLRRKKLVCCRCLAVFKLAPPLEAWTRVTSCASSATTCSTRSTSSSSGSGGSSSSLWQFWDSSTG